MKKIIIALALMLGAAMLVGVSSAPAQAYTCGSVVKYRTTDTESSNLLVAGRPVNFVLHVDKRECSDRDRVVNVWGTVEKSGGSCISGPWINDRYYVNPNVISDWNPGTQSAGCNGGQTDYIFFWNPPGGYQDIFASMTEANRCISMAWTVAVVGHTDAHGTTPAWCANGL